MTAAVAFIINLFLCFFCFHYLLCLHLNLNVLLGPNFYNDQSFCSPVCLQNAPNSCSKVLTSVKCGHLPLDNKCSFIRNSRSIAILQNSTLCPTVPVRVYQMERSNHSIGPGFQIIPIIHNMVFKFFKIWLPPIFQTSSLIEFPLVTHPTSFTVFILVGFVFQFLWLPPVLLLSLVGQSADVSLTIASSGCPLSLPRLGLLSLFIKIVVSDRYHTSLFATVSLMPSMEPGTTHTSNIDKSIFQYSKQL